MVRTKSNGDREIEGGISDGFDFVCPRAVWLCRFVALCVLVFFQDDNQEVTMFPIMGKQKTAVDPPSFVCLAGVIETITIPVVWIAVFSYRNTPIP